MTRTALPGVVAVIGLSASALTLAVQRSDPAAFDRIFGGLPPAGVVIGVSVLAYPLLRYLGDRGWGLCESGGPVWWTVLVGAVLLSSVAIVADLALRFPEDMNVASPRALAFYPAVAWVVEVVLHTLPLVLLVAAFGSPDSVGETRFWLMAATIASIEAVIQALFATTAGTAVFSALHLLAVGVFQVYLFRRFGFLPMLGFRLAYYAIWHLAWGAVRIPLLF